MALNVRLAQLYKKWLASIWVFPVILTALLGVFTLLQLNGSSIGEYHKLFYGGARDDDLLANQSRPIRSDEWLVNTQMAIAQEHNDYQRINQNIGNGQDMSLMIDAPYKDWSTIFKPHNLGFLFMPFDNAFAFRWWLMAYLLVLSCYFFVLALLPGKRLVASLLAVGLLFAPFVQWWYLYGTLGSLFYSLFAATVIIKIVQEKRRLQSILWAGLLTYIGVCFALMLYPPYQIGCAIVLVVFAISYLFQQLRQLGRKAILAKVGLIVAAAIISGTVTAGFLAARSEVIQTVQNTAYPGKRIQASGSFDAAHLFSGYLGAQLQFDTRAEKYNDPEKGLTNQSENANFALLTPFLLLPSFYLLFQQYKRKEQLDWPLLATSSLFLLLMCWLLTPGVPVLGKVLLLEYVPHFRLLIAFGLLNIVQLVLFIRHYGLQKKFTFSHTSALVYTVITFVVTLYLGVHAMQEAPGFIGIYRIIGFSLAITLIVYCLLRKYFMVAAAILLILALYSSVRVHPIYRGTETLRTTPLSLAIQDISSKDNDARWVADHFLLENFAYMNGARSLTGVYTYPQLDIWKNADPKAKQDIYNRYAHTIFVFDRDAGQTISTKVYPIGADFFGIMSEPCNAFFKKQGVGYLLTNGKLDPKDTCASIAKEVVYPTQTFYIYKLTF